MRGHEREVHRAIRTALGPEAIVSSHSIRDNLDSRLRSCSFSRVPCCGQVASLKMSFLTYCTSGSEHLTGNLGGSLSGRFSSRQLDLRRKWHSSRGDATSIRPCHLLEISWRKGPEHPIVAPLQGQLDATPEPSQNRLHKQFPLPKRDSVPQNGTFPDPARTL